MTDRKLLELAAKAADLGDCWFDALNNGYVVHHTGIDFDIGCNCLWNPLESDGDYLRLEVQLKMTAAWEPMLNGWSIGAIVNGEFKWLSFDENRKTAGVRAAAEIGKVM